MSANPELVAKQKQERLHQRSIMACGVECEIVEYFSSAKVVVRFDNGDVVTTAYTNFKNKCIKSPTARKEYEDNLHIGEVRQFQNGGHGKLIRRTNNRKLVAGHPTRTYIVRYEEDGYETEVTYPQFQSGRVFHPIFNKTLASVSNSKTNEYIGKVFKLDCGVSVKVINYYPSKQSAKCDIQVVGTEHIIKDVNIKTLKSGKYFPAVIRIGEVRTMSNGLKAKIIDINDTGGIVDVEFEDGVIVKNRRYQAFVSGAIGNPNITSGDQHSKKNDRVNTVHKMNNGFSLKVTDYKTENNVDVVFDDGSEIKGTSYSQIKRKSLMHPNVKSNGIGSYLTFELNGILQKEDNDTYYKCRCLKCNLEEALTPDEMNEHKC